MWNSDRGDEAGRRAPIVTRARLRDIARTGRHVVVRAPQGFGKTTLLDEWEAASSQHIVRLRGRAVPAGGFWAALLSAWPGSDEAEHETGSYGRIVELLRASGGETILMLDDMQRVAERAVLEDLAALATWNPALRIVVSSRARHRIEDLLDGPIATITAEELAFTAAEVVAVARDLGVRLDEGDAETVVLETGGWPALVGKALQQLARGSTGPDRLRAVLRAADEGLSAWLQDDTVSPAQVDLLVQLAIAEHLDLGAAQFLTGDAGVLAALDELVLLGLLTRRIEETSGDVLFEFPSMVRRLALAGMGRAPAADSDRRSAALARWFRDQGRPEIALRQAMAGREWELVAELFESHWLDLVNADDDLVVGALRQIPESVASAYPKAHAVRYIVLGAVMGPQELPRPITRSFLDVVELATRSGAVSAAEVAVAEFIVLRRSGRYRDAVRRGRVAHHLAQIVGPHVPDYLIPMVPMARLQLALTYLLADRQVDAAEQLGLSLTALEPMVAPDPLEQNQITGLAAVVAAVQGDLEAVDAWGGRELPVEGRMARMWLMPFIPTGHRLARAVAAVDRLDRDEAERQLLPLRVEEARDELWAIGAWARARFDLHWSDRVSALRDVDLTRRRHDAWHNEESFAEPLLLAAEIDLLLADGRANRVAALLAGAAKKHPVLRLSRARLAWLTGDIGGARTHTRAVLRAGRAGDRVRLDALILWAVLASGDDRDVAWSEAAAAARRLGTPAAPFTFAPRGVLQEASSHSSVLSHVVDVLDERQAEPVLPERIELISLTERERAVLGGIAKGLTVASIARAHYVSEATVKTQLRSLYAKLGAHSREEAVSSACEVGLL